MAKLHLYYWKHQIKPFVWMTQQHETFSVLYPMIYRTAPLSLSLILWELSFLQPVRIWKSLIIFKFSIRVAIRNICLALPIQVDSRNKSYSSILPFLPTSFLMCSIHWAWFIWHNIPSTFVMCSTRQIICLSVWWKCYSFGLIFFAMQPEWFLFSIIVRVLSPHVNMMPPLIKLSVVNWDQIWI